MNSKQITFVFPDNNQGNFLLNNNGEYQLNMSPFNNLSSSVITECFLCLQTEGDISLVNYHNIKLYQVNSDNTLELIDVAEMYGSAPYILKFNISKYLFLKKHKTTSLVLKNETGNGVLLSHTNNSMFDITNYVAEVDLSMNTNDYRYSFGKDYSISINPITQNHRITKKLFDKLLPYDVSLIYSNINRYYWFMSGWRLNLIESANTEWDDDCPVGYIDKNNNQHRFIKIDDTPYYHSVDGSGLIIKENIVNNQVDSLELFNDLTDSKKIFNFNGIIKRIIDENGEETHITHNSFYEIINYIDPNGNTIKYITANNSSTYSITLNEEITHLIYHDNYGDVYALDNDEVEYNEDERLVSITTELGEVLTLTYDGDLLISIEITKDDFVIERTEFEYDYLAIKSTNTTGVKTITYFNKNLEVTMQEEYDEDNLNQPVLSFGSNVSMFEDTQAWLNKQNGCRWFSNNLPDEYLFNYDGNIIFNNFSSIGDSFLYEGQRKLLLIAGIEKNFDLPLQEKRNITIEMRTSDSGNTLVATLEFNPFLSKQYVATTIDSSFNNGNPISGYYLRAHIEGMSGFGGVRVFNPIIVELEKSEQVTYFANLDDDINGDIQFELTGESLTEDGLDWQQFLYAEDVGNNNVTAIYFYKDLLRNYLSVEKNSHFYWSENLKKCSYNSTSPSLSNGGYLLRQHRNIQTHNTLFGKKTFIKRYKDSNNNEKEIYDFEYLLRNSSGEFVLTIIHHIGDSSYKESKTYDEDFRLIKEIKYDGSSVLYSYDTNGNLEKTITNGIPPQGMSSDGIFRTIYQYDSNNRIDSISSLVSDSIESKSFTYVDDYEIEETVTDENDDVLTNTYNADYSYISKIEKNNVEVNKDLSDPYDYKFFNGVAFTFATTFSSSLQTKTFAIKDLSLNTTVFSEIYLTQYNNSGLINTYKSIGSKHLKTEFNKYNNPIRIGYRLTGSAISNAYTYFTYFYYFDEYDENVVPTISGTQSQNDITSKSKLYKIRETNIQRQTIYNYDENNNVILEQITDTSSTPIEKSKTEYTYDFLNRVKTKTNEFDSIDVSYTFTYQDLMSSVISVNKIESSLFGSSAVFITQNIDRDSFSRLDNIHTKYGLLHNQEYKTKYIYHSKNISENNQTIKLESSLIKRMDYYKPYHTPGTPLIVCSLTYDYSEHIEYDVKGNIKSIKKGDTSGYITGEPAIQYQYSPEGRLNLESVDSNHFIGYLYDNNGNITSKLIKDGNSLTTISYQYNLLYKDELKKYNGITISYNSARYPTSYGNNISFTWDNFFHLSSYTKNNDTTSYTYNYQGIRTKKTLSDGTIREYILEGKRIVAEKITSNNASTYITYLYGQDGVLGMYYNNSFYYFRKNILGDVIEIYSGETLIAKYSYTAYGETKVFNGSGVDITNDSTQINHIGRINPFRYRGYYYDEESGMYYCNARYYVPEWCRWLSKDESEYLDPNTIDGLNLYAYCLNNPIMYRDENGTFWTFLLILLVGIGLLAVTGAVVGTIEYFIWDNNGWINPIGNNYENGLRIENGFLIPGFFSKLFFLLWVQLDGNSPSKRTVFDQAVEWSGHNVFSVFSVACCFLFGVFSAKDIEMYYWNLFYEHTKDIDIENDECWYKFWERII